MAQKKVRAAIVSQEKLAEGIFSMWLDAPEMAAASRPGQFIAVYTNDPSKLLPRPISICEADKEKGRLRIVYRIAGAGTLEFSGYQAGDTLDIMGPLGNGFPLKDKKAFLIGGGIGIPPMLELAKNLEWEMTSENVYNMKFGKICPLLVNKAMKKGRTQGEVDQIITWLTGYTRTELEAALDSELSYGDFFRNAPAPNPARNEIKGVVCGVRVEEIEEPLMREIRYLDKLVDELARGKAMEKILRKLPEAEPADSQRLLFFEPHPDALPIYEVLEQKILKDIPGVRVKFQKTQISFYNKHMFACASFMRVRKKKDCPEPFLVVTFSLPHQVVSPRIDVATEPYPGRWTHHVLTASKEEIDDELMEWIREAAAFSDRK